MSTPRLTRSLLATIGLAVAAVACRDVAAPNENPAATTYATSLGVNLSQMTKTSSGLYYKDLVVGTGKAAAKDSVLKVYYTGWLTTGHQFDSNRGKTPFQFTVGGNQVIPGWDEGLIAGTPMRVGGRRLLVIPPELGYGFRTSGTIPAGSVLVFDVELVGVGL